jgi:small subunit ribosomal protein S16
VGSRKNPIWRVVVADQRSPRDGRVIETIGRYNAQTQPSEIQIDAERLQHWLARGAQPTETVRRLVRAQETGPTPAATRQRQRRRGREEKPAAVESAEETARAEEAEVEAAEAGEQAEGPAEEPAAEEAPADEPAAEEAPAEEPAAEEASTEEAPTEEAPADEAPAEDAGEAPEGEEGA